MNHLGKRMLAMTLMLVMCISLLSGVVFAGSSVTYQTGDADGFRNVIINWGKRGTDATFLSPNAIAFYEDNHITYDELSQMDGSSTVSSVPGSALYRELKELMSSNHSTITSYNDTKDLYRFTDCQNGNQSSISSFYSGKAIGPAWGQGSWNREHTWPNSKGSDGDDENDIMMLRPTATSENSSRGNKAYGQSAGYYDPNSVSNGAYDLHGDVARIMLYTYVRWGNTSKMWGTDGVMESVDVLLKWMEEDPVDTWELGRNDSVESITGTRNVFVDYPELAFILFGQDVPADMTTPSGEAVNGGIGHTITATVNNSAWGSATVSGKTINAVPAQGYQVKGYTVVSGTATVTRDGNAFTVSASSDCTVRIDFEARRAVSVVIKENGNQVSSQSAYVGDEIVMPSHKGNVPEGYTFQGWVTATVAETSVIPTGMVKTGSRYTVSGDVTFHALYSRLDANGSGTGSVFEKYEGELVEGDYLLTYDGGALKATVSDKDRFDYSDVTVANGAVDAPAADLIWHVSFAGGYVTLYNEAAGVYAGGNGTKNKGALLEEVTDYAKWSVTAADGTFDFVNKGNKEKGVNHTLRRNTTFGFACYHVQTGGALTLYKAASGTVYYSTTATACEHKNTVTDDGTDATCTENGYTAGVFCNDCQSYISGHEQIKAPGHTYNEVVTPPTATEQGYTTFTCHCGDTYVGNYTDPTGEDFILNFQVPTAVDPVKSMTFNASGVELPAAGVPDSKYTFVGWTLTTVSDTEAMPQVYAPGETFTYDSNVTLYALYSFTEGGSGSGEWTLVTDASQLTAGVQIVIASNDKGFVAAPMNGAYLTNSAANFSADKSTITTMPADAVIFTLGGEVSAWTLTSDGKLLGATAVKKLAWDKGTTTWSIAIEDGIATIQNGTDSYGRFLYNVNSPRFTTYTSNTNTSMLLPQLYMKAGTAGTTYYTTLDAQACGHENTEVRGQVDASCVAGYTGDTYCLDCGEKLANGTQIPATGVHAGGTEIRGELAAGCTDGYTGDTYCLGCGEMIHHGTVIPGGHVYGEYQKDENGHWKACACGDKTAQGQHTYGDWSVVRPAENGEDGLKERVCTECGYKQTDAITDEGIPGTGDLVMIGCIVILCCFGAAFLLISIKKSKFQG